jgi:hypothetical protein
MTETNSEPVYAQKATLIRERAFFAGFISLLFALAANGAVFLLDQGISILRGAQNWRETLIALGLLLVGGAVIGVTGLLWIAALQSLRLAWKMEKEGQSARGTILNKRVRQDGRKRFYHIEYGIGDNTRFDESIPEAQYQRLNVGDSINLRTLPGHPDIARLEKTK